MIDVLFVPEKGAGASSKPALCGYWRIQTHSVFAFGVAREPAALHPAALFLEFPDAPQAGDAHQGQDYGEQTAEKQGGAEKQYACGKD